MPKQRIVFSKISKARYISHLDLMRTLQRSFLRSGISIWHTEGFNPHPYVSIPLPLPLGFTSDCELLEFTLEKGATNESLPAQMNKVLPEGIQVHCCYDNGIPFRHLAFVLYQIKLEYASSDEANKALLAIQELMSNDTLVIKKKSKKAKSGVKELDILPLIEEVQNIQTNDNLLELTLLLQAQNPGLNPALLIGALIDRYPTCAPLDVQYHRIALFDKDKNPYI